MACSVHGRTKEARQVKGKAKGMIIIFFAIKGIVHKELILAGQTAILHIAVTFYGNCVKMCKDFAPNFGDKRLGVKSRQRTGSHFLFHH
jgi:hypothetical protein